MSIAKTVVSESLFVFFFLITCMHGYSQLASPDPSVCLTKVFSKSNQYSSAGFVHSFFELPDHSLITGGPMNGNYFLMKSDDSGNTVWCKKYTAIQTDQSRSLLDLNDQIISGFTEGVATTLAYMDTAGIPQSAYSIKTAFSPLSFVDLAITGNGD